MSVEVRRHTEIVPNFICKKISYKHIFFQILQLSIKYNTFEKERYKHKFNFVLQNFPILLLVEWNMKKLSDSLESLIDR